MRQKEGNASEEEKGGKGEGGEEGWNGLPGEQQDSQKTLPGQGKMMRVDAESRTGRKTKSNRRKGVRGRIKGSYSSWFVRKED